jgi:hypothetical protein
LFPAAACQIQHFGRCFPLKIAFPIKHVGPGSNGCPLVIGRQGIIACLAQIVYIVAQNFTGPVGNGAPHQSAGQQPTCHPPTLMGPGLNLVPAVLLTYYLDLFAFGKGLHWGVGAPRAFPQDDLFPSHQGSLAYLHGGEWFSGGLSAPEKAG